MTGAVANTTRGQPEGYFQVGMVGESMDSLDRMSSVEFLAVVELDGEIDQHRMDRAWSEVLDRHPILRCSRDGRMWMFDAEAPGPASLTVEAAAAGPRLIITCDHVAFDGLGSLILLQDLHDAYVGSDHRAGPDWSPRIFEQIAGITDVGRDLAASTRAALRWVRARPSTHRDPAPLIPDTPASQHTVMELGPVLASFAPRRRSRGWSTDALLVAVLERAWSEVFGPPSGSSVWLVAQDLRNDLGISRGMGNLSLIDAVNASGSVLEAADALTSQLRSQHADLVTGALLGARLGSLSSALATAALPRSRRLRYFRSLSNVGQLGESLDDWGTSWAAKVYFVGPMAHPPYTSFIAAGRGESTLVTVRTSPDWLTPIHARDLEAAAVELASQH